MEELIEQLESTHGKQWSMWCAVDGGYVVSLDQHHKQFLSETLPGALRDAAAWRDLPKFPREPAPVPIRDRYAAVKSGSKWNLEFDGVAILCNQPSRKCLYEFLDKWEPQQRKRIEQWDTFIRPQIAGLTEGVDFEFLD